MRRNPSQLRYSEDKMNEPGNELQTQQQHPPAYPSVLGGSQPSAYNAPTNANGGMSYAALSSTNRDQLEVMQSPFQPGTQYNSHQPVYSSVIDDSTPHHAFFDLNAWDCLMQNFNPLGSTPSRATPSANVAAMPAGGAGAPAVPNPMQTRIPGTLPGPSYGPI